MRISSSCRRRRVILSIAANGSSISMIAGSAASARARPTRCCCPPESCAGIARAVLGGRQADQVEQFVHPRVDARRVPAQQARHHRDILRHPHMREQADALDDIADAAAAVRSPAGCAMSRPPTRIVPAGRLVEPVDHLQQRGLAAARRPQQAPPNAPPARASSPRRPPGAPRRETAWPRAQRRWHGCGMRGWRLGRS